MPKIKDTSEFSVTVVASKEGYKTVSTTETVKVNKANGSLILSSTSGTIEYPNSTTITVSGNTGTLSAVSNNTNIATVSVSGNTVTVKPGTTAGKATITVTSAAATNYNAKSATYIATVNNGTISLSATPYSGTYDGKAHNAITKVTVTPSDAKIEYSTNGTTYSTTMPTITNTSSFTVTVRASKAGYKTQSVTQTVKVNKAAGTLTLSATSGTLTYPTNATFTASGNKGTLSVASSNTNIATASVSGNTVTVKPGTTAGKATITVTSAATTNYNEKSATYTATVNNGTISLSATPYTGTYDGKAHNAITKVTVTPGDAKIEYSTNGTNYSTTMPTITNTSSFTVTVRASKAGYKTQSTTQTVKVNKAAGTLTLSATSGTLEYPDSTMFTVSGNIGTLSVSSSNTNVATASISGNTVTVKSGTTAGTAIITVTSAATTNYNAKSATYSANIKTTINDIKIGDYVNYMYDSAANYNMDSSACGTSSNPTRGIPQTKNLKWQVLNVDKNNKTIDIIGSLTARNVSFYNMESYNNGVFILNDICEKQYSNNKLQVKARSVNLKDFEKQMTAQGFSTRNAYKFVIHYGNTIKESGYYPKLYKNQKGAGINTESVTHPSLTKDNPDPYDESSAIYNTTITNVCSMASTLTITQTYYKMSINSNNYGDAAKVLSTSSYYWVAARCVNRGNWEQEFGLRYASSSELTGYSLSPSSTGISGSTYYYHSLLY